MFATERELKVKETVEWVPKWSHVRISTFRNIRRATLVYSHPDKQASKHKIYRFSQSSLLISRLSRLDQANILRYCRSSGSACWLTQTVWQTITNSVPQPVPWGKIYLLRRHLPPSLRSSLDPSAHLLTARRYSAHLLHQPIWYIHLLIA